MTPVLLHIETSTFEGSIALSKGDALVKELILPSGEKYVKTLAKSVESLLAEAKMSMNALNGVSISSGPGSYTGLRIGASLCKGIAHGLDIPLIAVPTLKILAQAIFEKHDTGVAIPLMDARRMEVYTAAYQRDWTQQLSTTAMVMDEASFGGFVGSDCVFAGNGSGKCRELLEEKNGFQVDSEIQLSAACMVSLALKAFASRAFESVAGFEPHYLKEFQVGKSSKISNILRG